MSCVVKSSGRCSGFILSLVLGVLLCLTLCMTTLLWVPGGVRRYAGNVVKEVQRIYDGESALMLYSRGILDGENVPEVNERLLGPYLEMCAEPVCGYAVKKISRRHYGEYHQTMENYRRDLRERILGRGDLRRFSGNKRIFDLNGIRSGGNAVSLVVEDGDLLLDLSSRDTLKSVNVVDQGNVVIAGNVVYDTLRIISQGDVTLKGNVQVGFLEVAAGERLEIGGNICFRGFGTAWREITLKDHVQGMFPSMLMAIGSNAPEANLLGKSGLRGLLLAPAGTVNGVGEDESPAGANGLAVDSLRLALPGFFEGENLLFDSRLAQ